MIEKTEPRVSDLTKIILDVAKKRGIKIKWLSSKIPLFKLELNGKSFLFYKSVCNQVGSVSYLISNRKHLSTTILKEFGITVPREILINCFDDALNFLKKYKQIVVKPENLQWGLGVTAGITNKRMLKNAMKNLYKNINKEDNFIVQEFVEGDDFRILVVGYDKIFCLQRNPASVEGDGVSTIKELINQKKIKTGDLNKFLKISSDTIKISLESQNLNFDSVLPKKKQIKLSTAANAHFGGITIDKTKDVCDDAIKIAKLIAKELKMPLVGVDLISTNISKNPGRVIEINGNPDLAMHVSPNLGKGYNPADALIDFLFFSGKENDLKRKIDLS